MFLKILAAILGGLIISMIGSVIVGLSAGGGVDGGDAGSSSFFIFYLISFAIAFMSQTAKQAWKRLLITSAILCFMLPISSMLFTGIFVAEETSGAAEAAGGLIGGALVTGVTGFFGFFMGVIFLVIGLLIKEKKDQIEN